jgi:hypothetical protein
VPYILTYLPVPDKELSLVSEVLPVTDLIVVQLEALLETSIV